MTELEEHGSSEELLDEESLAVLAILLAVSLEFGFGFAKTVDWWAGLIAGPAALATLVVLFRLRRTHAGLVRMATWVVRARSRRPRSYSGRRGRVMRELERDDRAERGIGRTGSRVEMGW